MYCESDMIACPVMSATEKNTYSGMPVAVSHYNISFTRLMTEFTKFKHNIWKYVFLYLPSVMIAFQQKCNVSLSFSTR